MSVERPSLDVAVILQRTANTGAGARWQAWRWELVDVVMNQASFGSEPRLLYENESTQRWLHPGLKTELFKDDAEGYYLNATTDGPSWFVLWRMEDLARPCPSSLNSQLNRHRHPRQRWKMSSP